MLTFKDGSSEYVSLVVHLLLIEICTSFPPSADPTQLKELYSAPSMQERWEKLDSAERTQEIWNKWNSAAATLEEQKKVNSQLGEMNQELEETKQTLQKTLEAVLSRGEKISDMAKRIDQVRTAAQNFHTMVRSHAKARGSWH
jgi:DNA replication protein DnaD